MLQSLWECLISPERLKQNAGVNMFQAVADGLRSNSFSRKNVWDDSLNDIGGWLQNLAQDFSSWGLKMCSGKLGGP